MKHINDLISCLNKLNQNGRIQYDDYSELVEFWNRRAGNG